MKEVLSIWEDVVGILVQKNEFLRVFTALKNVVLIAKLLILSSNNVSSVKDTLQWQFTNEIVSLPDKNKTVC